MEVPSAGEHKGTKAAALVATTLSFWHPLKLALGAGALLILP